MRSRLPVLLLTLVLTAAVGGSGLASARGALADGTDPFPPAAGTPAAVETQYTPAGERPYTLFVPAGTATADGLGGASRHLVLGLHGYGDSAAKFERYWNLRAHAERVGFLYARPLGLRDRLGHRAWNASAACCGRGPRADDVRYLRAVVEDVRSRYAVDERRIYVVGKSNGGFMAHTLACRAADLVAAVVSFAGAGPSRERACRPSSPVSVLQIHGTADRVVRYAGGRVHHAPVRHPGAVETTEAWARRDGCRSRRTTPRARDLVRALPGRETGVDLHTRCRGGAQVVLWTLAGAQHTAAPTPALRSGVVRFLLAHARR